MYTDNTFKVQMNILSRVPYSLSHQYLTIGRTRIVGHFLYHKTKNVIIFLLHKECAIEFLRNLKKSKLSRPDDLMV